MLLTPVPFIPWQSGLSFPRYNLTLKIQGQRYPSQRNILLTHFLSVSHQGILSTPVLSFHDNRPSHSWDTIWPWKFKVKGTPVSTASSRLISVVLHIRASYRLPSLSLHDNRSSHSRDTIWPKKFKVKGQGTLISVASSWLIFFYFTSIGPTIPRIWQIECSTGENRSEILWKKLLKKKLWQNVSKIQSGRKHDEGDIPSKFCSDWMSCSHFTMGTR